MKWSLPFLLLTASTLLLSSCHNVPMSSQVATSYQSYESKIQPNGFAEVTGTQGEGRNEPPEAYLQAKKITALLNQAQRNLSKHRPQQALADLKKVQPQVDSLDNAGRLNFFGLLTQAYFETQDTLAAIDSSTITASLLDKEEDRKAYLASIWETLQRLTPEQVDSLYSQADNATQRGWLSLVNLMDKTTSGQRLADGLKNWQINYFNHPAETFILNSLDKPISLPTLPTHITLLLPLTGPLAKQGRAIRNGFLAAFYESKSSGYSPEIQVLDTHQTDILSLYQKAVQQGAKLIVGPLRKTNIEQLISSQQLTLPVIALNNITSDQPIPNLYQFGLSPEDEVTQVARRMINHGHKNILLIRPDNPYGLRIKSAFENAWTELGGHLTAQLTYDSRHTLAHKLRALLNLDKSKARELNLHWTLREKLRYIPRRRKDFDAVFVIASPSMGKQIIPLLKFFYVNNVPLYSTSEIYQGTLRHKDRDIDGVIFNDIPWLFMNGANLPQKVNAIRTNAASAWPASFKHYPRFYALGADAFNLISSLNKLSLVPDFGINGATGTLYLQHNGQIYRKLSWAQVERGKPSVLMP